MNFRSLTDFSYELYSSDEPQFILDGATSSKQTVIAKCHPKRQKFEVDDDTKYVRRNSTTLFYSSRTGELHLVSPRGIQASKINGLTKLLAVTASSVTYWSSELEMVISHNLQTGEDTFVAASVKPPAQFENGFYTEGVLGLADKTYPIDAMLAADPTLPESTTFLQLGRLYKESFLSSGDVANPIQPTYSSQVLTSSDEFNLASDLDGGYLMIQEKVPSHYVSAAVIDFESYLASGCVGFFHHASLSTFRDLESVPSRLQQIIPAQGGFLSISKVNDRFQLYSIDASVLSNFGSQSVLSVKPILLGSSYTAHSSMNSDLVVTSTLPEDSSTNLLVHIHSNQHEPRATHDTRVSYDGASAVFLCKNRNSKISMPVSSVINTYCTGLSLDVATKLIRTLKEDRGVTFAERTLNFNFAPTFAYTYSVGSTSAEVSSTSPTSTHLIEDGKIRNMLDIASKPLSSSRIRRSY